MKGMFDVVVPAGGLIDGDYAAQTGTTIRALAPLGSARRPVLQVVVDALRGSECVRDIVVVGSSHLCERINGVDLWLEEAPLILPGVATPITAAPANALRGLQALSSETPALLCTSDLPFLTSAAITDFVDRIAPDCRAAAGVVAAADYEQRYPAAPPSQYVRLVETGPVAPAGVFMVQPSVLLASSPLLSAAFEGRKSQWRMTSLLGIALIARFVVNRLSIRSISRRLETLLHCPVTIVDKVQPELSFDIDTIEDYVYASERV